MTVSARTATATPMPRGSSSARSGSAAPLRCGSSSPWARSSATSVPSAAPERIATKRATKSGMSSSTSTRK